ncbi:MAG: hypothetical protein LBM20_06175 [Rikenellaceae bacterium]|jgi:hypothetical protein|nr:hypothetical protein [Rikenellaceae bacterium]
MNTVIDISTPNCFYALYENGEYVQNKHFSMLPQTPEIKYYMRSFPPEKPYVTSNNKYYYYNRFEFVDSRGNPYKLRIGKFEVNYIDYDEGTWEFKGRKIIIQDLCSGEYHSYNMHKGCASVSSFITHLIPFLENLNKAGSWEKYHNPTSANPANE